jgi:16S rRNA (cytosine967-C5)-methyltransferase
VQTPYKNLVKTTAAGLKRVFAEGQHAEQVLERLLASDKRLGARDRRFIAETFYDLVRYWRQLEVLKVRQQIPDEDDYFLLVCLWLAHKGYDLNLWPETVNWNFGLLQEQITGETKIVASYPDWLWDLGVQEIGEGWSKEIHALNQTAPIYIRVNSLKSNPLEVKEILKIEGVEAELLPNHPDGLKLVGRTNVIRLGSFRKGLYEVQDAASQKIAPFLQTEPGQLVIDACAGAGGKSLHLAALMEDQGKIVSMDIEGWKLEEVKKRASRAGLKSITTEFIKGNKTIKFWDQKADRVLLDAPCSGLGVLRRHPGTKWKLQLSDYDDVREIQAEILDSYSRMVKPGGKLVYATCSLMPGENENQVKEFLSNHSEFELEEQHRTWPSEGWDGFFMARMKRIK